MCKIAAGMCKNLGCAKWEFNVLNEARMCALHICTLCYEPCLRLRCSYAYRKDQKTEELQETPNTFWRTTEPSAAQ